MKTMGQDEEKSKGSQLALVLLCVLVLIFACCAIVFVALYFIKYGEDNGKYLQNFLFNSIKRSRENLLKF